MRAAGCDIWRAACGILREWILSRLVWVVVLVIVILLMFDDVDSLMFGDVDGAVDDVHW